MIKYDELNFYVGWVRAKSFARKTFGAKRVFVAPHFHKLNLCRVGNVCLLPPIFIN